MPEQQYTIILDPDEEEGCYSVTVPALAGCIPRGRRSKKRLPW
jgi:predicted RNase H-like HicB family nuclease